jgi:hypothetical protein
MGVEHTSSELTNFPDGNIASGVIVHVASNRTLMVLVPRPKSSHSLNEPRS